MKHSILILILTAFVSYNSMAQNSIMEEEVKSALSGYLSAGDTNDSNTLLQYLHDAFRVVLYDGSKDTASVLDRATYVTFIKEKKFGGYIRTVSYQSVHFIGEHMATIQVILTSPDKPTLKNFYSLVKVGGTWLVIQDFVTLIP